MTVELFIVINVLVILSLTYVILVRNEVDVGSYFYALFSFLFLILTKKYLTTPLLLLDGLLLTLGLSTSFFNKALRFLIKNTLFFLSLVLLLASLVLNPSILTFLALSFVIILIFLDIVRDTFSLPIEKDLLAITLIPTSFILSVLYFPFTIVILFLILLLLSFFLSHHVNKQKLELRIFSFILFYLTLLSTLVIWFNWLIIPFFFIFLFLFFLFLLLFGKDYDVLPNSKDFFLLLLIPNLAMIIALVILSF